MNDDWDKITFYYKNSKFDLAWLMRHWIIFDTPKCTNPYLYLSLHSTPLYTMLHLSNLRIHAPFTCIGTGADNFRVKNSIQIIRPVWPTFCGRKNSLLSYKLCPQYVDCQYPSLLWSCGLEGWWAHRPSILKNISVPGHGWVFREQVHPVYEACGELWRYQCISSKVV